jgi:hypothetical protein
MSQQTNNNTNNTNNTNNIVMENNMLKSEIVNLHKKIISIEDQMKQINETNNNMAYELSQIMPYLKSFASDVSDDLHYIRYK